MSNPWELTEEERKRLTNKGWTAWEKSAPPAQKRPYVGDPVPCPRCGRMVCSPRSERPCQSCQIKALEAEVERLRERLANLAGAKDLGLVAAKSAESRAKLKRHGISY